VPITFAPARTTHETVVRPLRGLVGFIGLESMSSSRKHRRSTRTVLPAATTVAVDGQAARAGVLVCGQGRRGVGRGLGGEVERRGDLLVAAFELIDV
jgi:hypothetical protein